HAHRGPPSEESASPTAPGIPGRRAGMASVERPSGLRAGDSTPAGGAPTISAEEKPVRGIPGGRARFPTHRPRAGGRLEPAAVDQTDARKVNSKNRDLQVGVWRANDS